MLCVRGGCKNENMNKEDLKIGQILEVTTSNGIHYEKVVQIENEVITDTMQEWEGEEICKQGLTDNWEYRIVPDHELVRALKFKKRVVLQDHHCICQYDQYGGATNPKCLLHGNG